MDYWIIDGMALLQSLKCAPNLFTELATNVLQMIISTVPNNKPRIDLVMDQYPVISIKNPERMKRAKEGSLKIDIQEGKQKCPTQWKKFLSDGNNKTNVAAFFLQEWQHQDYFTNLARLHTLYVTHGEECHMLTALDNNIACSKVDNLCTKQEEADTRMLLHASHAASDGHTCIIIKSPDTDVAVLACYFSHQIDARLLFCTGTKQRQRYIDITDVGQLLGADVCNALPGMHSFTGCDSTSAFVGKGKKQAFQLVESDPHMCTAMEMVGQSFSENTEQLQQRCAEFICSLYGYSGYDIDSVRYKLFCSKNAQTCHLPPTRDAMKYHVARANYQARVWRLSLQADASIPSPAGHGWDVDDNNLSIHWMDQQPAPKSLLQLISCNCSKKHCDGGRCTCRKNAMPCTDVCGCTDCSNSKSVDDIVHDTSDDEDTDD